DVRGAYLAVRGQRPHEPAPVPLRHVVVGRFGAPDEPLDGVAAVVQEQHDRGHVPGEDRGELLDGELGGAVAHKEHRSALPGRGVETCGGRGSRGWHVRTAATSSDSASASSTPGSTRSPTCASCRLKTAAGFTELLKPPLSMSETTVPTSTRQSACSTSSRVA